MKRSVLVMDTPETCRECKLSDVNLKDLTVVCRATGQMAEDSLKGCEDLKAGCPLRRLPQKRYCNYYEFETYTNGVDKGWNLYYDAIVGE